MKRRREKYVRRAKRTVRQQKPNSIRPKAKKKRKKTYSQNDVKMKLEQQQQQQNEKNNAMNEYIWFCPNATTSSAPPYTRTHIRFHVVSATLNAERVHSRSRTHTHISKRFGSSCQKICFISVGWRWALNKFVVVAAAVCECFFSSLFVSTLLFWRVKEEEEEVVVIAKVEKLSYMRAQRRNVVVHAACVCQPQWV